MGEGDRGVEYLVERTGLEPVTSALSKQRSEPTELTFRAGKISSSPHHFLR